MRNRNDALEEYNRVVKQHDEIINEMRILRSKDRSDPLNQETAERLIKEYGPLGARLQLLVSEVFIYPTDGN